MAVANTETLERIKLLNETAASVGGYFARHKLRIASANVDKHEARFAGRTDRFAAFNVSATFTCHTGIYGNSGCSIDLGVRTAEVEPYFILAMAKHQELLFATAAELMREDAAKLTEKARAEIASLVAMVDALGAPAEAEKAA